MLLYHLEKREGEVFMYDDGEFSFILGNQEPDTRGKNSQELLELLDQVVRW
jgi:hypothetical protein